MTDDEVRGALRSFILANFLPGEAPETLKDTTPLITTGVVTSLAMLELVAFIEESFAVNLEPEDFRVVRMDSIEKLAALVAARAERAPDSGGSSG
jgi:acyl carrier protein